MVLLAASMAEAETNFWVGGGADLNWSTAANWSNNVPGAATDTFFHTDGAVPDTATVNNIVSSDLTVQSLTYLHVNQGNTIIHNTQIADGVTLTVSNPVVTTNVFMVGTGTNNATSTMTTTTVSGLGGILSVNAPVGVFNVRNGGIGMYSGYAKLDLSGLGTFKANVSQAYLAGDGTNTEVGGPGTGNRYKDRAACYVVLAQTNLITLLATNGQGLIFASGVGNNAIGSTLKLGYTNAILSNLGMLMGGPKSGASIVDFNSPGSYLFLRNTAGTGPQSFWGIGDPSAGYGAGPMSCTVDLTQGSVDAWVNQLVVGRSYREGNKTGLSSGTLKVAAGTIMANSMLVGYDMADYCAGINGTVELSGTAQLVVSNALTLGRFRKGDPTNGLSQAKLDIRDGASVQVYGGLTSSFNDPANFDNQLNVVSASLHVRGGFGPFANLELNSSTITLDISTVLNPAGALCHVTNLTTVSPITLNIRGSIPAAGQFPLIKYGALTGGAGTDITSFSLPSYVQGYLSNNVENSSIDLVVTAVKDSELKVTQSLAAGGRLQLSGTCTWTNASYRVFASTNLVNWTSAGSGSFVDGVFSYSDYSITNYPERYYRVLAP